MCMESHPGTASTEDPLDVSQTVRAGPLSVRAVVTTNSSNVDCEPGRETPGITRAPLCATRTTRPAASRSRRPRHRTRRQAGSDPTANGVIDQPDGSPTIAGVSQVEIFPVPRSTRRMLPAPESAAAYGPQKVRAPTMP